MIDIKTHVQMHQTGVLNQTFTRVTSRCTLEDTSQFDNWVVTMPTSEELDDRTAMMLPESIVAFELESKTWGMSQTRNHNILAHKVIVKLNVKHIEPVIWNKKAFERLVLEPQSKELIQALVSVHMATKRLGDIMPAKEKGLLSFCMGAQVLERR